MADLTDDLPPTRRFPVCIEDASHAQIFGAEDPEQTCGCGSPLAWVSWDRRSNGPDAKDVEALQALIDAARKMKR